MGIKTVIQRQCPKCDSGIMSGLYSFRGWGVETLYICDKCGHSKIIYESSSTKPYMVFILFEILLFIMSDNHTTFSYAIYAVVFVFLSFMLYKAYKYDSYILGNYTILDTDIDGFEPNATQQKVLQDYLQDGKKSTNKIRYILSFLIFISYSVMFYFENDLTYIDYVFYLFVAIVLPLWLSMTKIKD